MYSSHERSHVPTAVVPTYHSFRHEKVDGIPAPPNDDLRFDLLLRGLIDKNAMRFSLSDSSAPYYIRRDASDRYVPLLRVAEETLLRTPT